MMSDNELAFNVSVLTLLALGFLLMLA